MTLNIKLILITSLFAMLPKKNVHNHINEKDQWSKQIKKGKTKVILGNVALNALPLYSGADCINIFTNIETVSNYWLYINCFPLKKRTQCNWVWLVWHMIHGFSDSPWTAQRPVLHKGSRVSWWEAYPLQESVL